MPNPPWASSYAGGWSGRSRAVLNTEEHGAGSRGQGVVEPEKENDEEKETEPRGVDGRAAGVALERSGRATDAGCPRGGGGSKDLVGVAVVAEPRGDAVGR